MLSGAWRGVPGVVEARRSAFVRPHRSAELTPKPFDCASPHYSEAPFRALSDALRKSC